MLKMTGNVQSNGSSNLEIAQSNQDLIMSKGKRKKRTWIIAGTVIIIIIALIIAAIVLLTNNKDSHENNAPELAHLSLEDILQGKVNPITFNATWVSGSELLYTDSNRNLVLHNVASRSKAIKILLSADEEILRDAFSFDISADGNYLLVGHRFQKIYRHSYRARYTIIDLSSIEQFNLSVDAIQDLLLVIWSPVGNALAFVAENNIYYKTSVRSNDIKTVTKDGEFIYNGIPDWVYEEEIFSSNKAMWFSPDGTKLAYARFYDKETPIMVLPIYGDPGSLFFQYPRAQLIRYPKVGTRNPTVTLHCANLNSVSEIQKLEHPLELNSTEPILSAVAWANNDVLSAIWMNRVQNRATVTSYALSGTTHASSIIKSLKQDSGWLELFTPPLFINNGTQLALILSQDQGADLGSYRHLVLLSVEENSAEIPLTSGPFVVTEILGYNSHRNEIFYLANTANDSAIQHIYSISPNTKTPKCLSCGIKSKNNQEECLYNSAEFSKDASHYVLTCAGPDVPDVAIYSLENSEHVLDWEKNLDLQELMNDKITPITERMSFEVEGGFKAQVMLRLPPDFDRSGNTKYPMLVNVYAGPDSFQVVEKFNLDWGSYLAANKSIIYATIDGRGSGLKGDKMLFASYRRLGTVEIDDQINVTKQIQDTLPYVDASRSAIWGWSYGGYASGMVLANDKEGVFKCGISVAPVTDWTLYDSIYTERFMGLPNVQDNLQGYINANLLMKYEGLRDKEYFLIHGTYDDNVHYQQSMLWAKVLEKNDILFRQLSYPDEDHGLGSVRPHLYHSLEDFLDECFAVK